MKRTLLLAIVCAAVVFALAELAYINIRAGFYAAIVGSAGVCLFLSCLKGDLRREMAVRSVTIAAAMPLLAWALPNVWLLHILMCFWVPIMAGRFDRLVPVYLFSLLLLPALDLTVSVGGLKLFEFGVLDALALGAATAILLSSKKARVPLSSDAWVCAILLVLGAALARDTSFSNFLRTSVNLVLDLGLPYLILSRGIRSPEDLRTALRWFACGGLALAALLTYETWKAWPLFMELYAQHQVPLVLMVKARAGLIRAAGPFIEPTSIALVMAMCIVALYLLRQQFRSRSHHYLLLIVAFIGLSAPQSRGAWIGLFIAIGAADLFCSRYSALLRKSMIGSLLVASVFALAQLSEGLSETVGLSGTSSGTSDYRRNLLARGLEEFVRSPLIGYSMPELSIRLADLRQGEGIIDFVNTYVWIGLIAGGMGLIAFLGTFLQFLARLWHQRRTITEQSDLQSAAFAFACTVMLVEMLFFTSFGGRPAFLTFALFGFSAAVLQTRKDTVRLAGTSNAASPNGASPFFPASNQPSS